MAAPLSLDVIESEFSEEYEAWALQDSDTKKYVVIPHPNYPGRSPIHFFMSRDDAESVLQEILDVNQALKTRLIVATKIKLFTSLPQHRQ